MHYTFKLVNIGSGPLIDLLKIKKWFFTEHTSAFHNYILGGFYNQEDGFGMSVISGYLVIFYYIPIFKWNQVQKNLVYLTSVIRNYFT